MLFVNFEEKRSCINSKTSKKFFVNIKSQPSLEPPTLSIKTINFDFYQNIFSIWTNHKVIDWANMMTRSERLTLCLCLITSI
jgi:hypothetical protein